MTGILIALVIGIPWLGALVLWRTPDENAEHHRDRDGKRHERTEGEYQMKQVKRAKL